MFYFFAILGMELFGGKLVASDPAVARSSYGLHDYYRIHFDDLPTSLVALFYLLVVNNWPILAEGCVAATSRWARLYFLAFYVVAVLVVMNVFVAFVLDAYLTMCVLVPARGCGRPRSRAMAS